MGLTLDDYLKIKKGIEDTPPEMGKTIGDIEFQWTYSPKEGLISCERETDVHLFIRAMQLIGGNFGMFKPRDLTGVTAWIHNHPRGFMVPSTEDLSSLFKILIKHPDHYCDCVIASTENDEVSGFYELHYHGKISEIERFAPIPEKRYMDACASRYKEIEGNPEKFSYLQVGDSIFSISEMEKLVVDIMQKCEVEHRAIPMQGFEFRNWRFMPSG